MTAIILSIAFPLAIVGPGTVGGAEQVLTSLEAELVARGYGSIVIAREGSSVAGKLLPTAVRSGIITDQVREETTRAHQDNIDLAIATRKVDLVHMHGIDFHRYRIPANVPVLVTLHLPPSWYPEEIWSLPPNYQLQCVSETQRLACPAELREHLPIVQNGVPLPSADKLPTRRGYALMLSRICPEKNLHAGFDAAHLAGVPVLLAGTTFPYAEHLNYLREQIEPRLSDRARLLPPVSGAEKTRLLARARCLLLPTLAPETSSLVAMEALAVGTPVIAYDSGAIPEIVEHQRTGFLVRNVTEMAAAIERTGEIDSAECRAVAAERFSLARMVEEYITLYDDLPRPKPSGKITQHLASGPAEAKKVEKTNDLGRSTGELDPTQSLSVSVVTTTVELEALAPEWQTLWHEDRQATPFQHPGWLLPWWKHVGEGKLFTLAMRDAKARLIGLLPLYIYTQPVDGRRQLLLLGAGTSDYLDGLFVADLLGGAEPIAEAALQHLASFKGRWEDGILHQLRMASPLMAVAKRTGRQVFSSEPCSSIPVAGWHRVPAKIRLNAGRYRRRAKARGTLRYTVAATLDEARDGLDDLIALHAKRWQESGVLTSPAVQEHHRESVPQFFGAGLLCIFSLELDNRTVAVLYTLIDATRRSNGEQRDRRMYSYLIGFDPAFADLSPGTLLLSFAFDYCEAKGIARLDMLRGDEGYKELWGAVAEPTFGFTLTPDRHDSIAP